MPDTNDDTLSRRDLLAGAARLGAGAGLLLTADRPLRAEGTYYGSAAHAHGVAPATGLAQNTASNAPTVALIGCGGQGRGNMDGLMNHGCRVLAVCDPDTGHMGEAAQMVEKKQGKRPDEIKDFRKVLERKDIDAVIVATPDHWHALPIIYAAQAGKDAFCEKPISHNIVEGQRMVEAAQKYGRVIQVNTWQRSVGHFTDAIDYVRSGKLGKVTFCRAWKTGNGGTGRQSPKTPPTELDYDLWVGPAAFEPYQENRCHYNFRWYFNYAAGMTGDWGVHLMDIALLGMAKDNNLPMPTRVASYGGKWVSGQNDDRTTPDTQVAIYEFPGWTMQWEVRVGGQGVGGSGDHGTEFIGTEGRLVVDRNGWSIFDNGGKPVDKPGTNRGTDHQQNWIDAVKSRNAASLRSPIDSMYQTTTVCHLANLALLAGRDVQWDAAKNQVIGDKQAMNLLPYQRPYRKPWAMPKI